MTDWRRRGFLAAVAAGIGGLGVTAPRAHADATLSADVSVLEYTVIEGHVDRARIRITNRRPSRGEAIEPVVLGWAQGRQTQLPWEIAAPNPSVPPGQRRDLLVHAPGDVEDTSLRFVAGQPALLRVYDRGTEQRAHVRFTPKEQAGGRR